ncbi:MAG: branched-chain amino acid ABC transporter permease [Candidatus Limivicinus sp.]|nr:branched-chain amino acid ABC transporter permease [Candidatus Limivicinus sp.]
MKKLKTPYAYIINTVVLVALLVLGNMLFAGGALNRATKSVILQCGVYSIMAVSLNICTGYLGQLPLGHAGFMAVGAYAGALFWKAVPGLPTPVAIVCGILIAGLAAALFGVIIGVPALRLKGDYLAIITLGFGEIIRIAIINLPDITGGTPGLLNVPKYTNFTVTFLCLVVCCFVVHNLMHSRHGRAILAIRDNEIAADCCGINLTAYKVFAFALSAFFAGVAGAVYAGLQGSLFPKSFDFMASINVLVMVVLGGMGSMTGSIIAATVLTALPLIMQSFNSYRMVAYSLLLIVVMIFKPSGLLGHKDFSMTKTIEYFMNFKAIRARKKEVAPDE